MNRNIFAALSVGVCMVALATPAQAQQREYRIPAGGLKAALDAYARQSGRQVIYKSDEVRSARSNGANGPMSADAALNTILAGTNFSARTDSSGAVAIVRLGNDQPAPASTASDTSSGSEDIVVTGTNIRGLTSIPAPHREITRIDAAKAGLTTIEQIVSTIPENFALVGTTGRFATEGGSNLAINNNELTTAIDLRGLGPQSTLTLVNGLRRAGSLGGRVVDISVIPAAMIDRIEILTGGNSAIYGSDAVAGVANIVPRLSMDGAETHLSITAGQYGGTTFNANQAVGFRDASGGMLIGYDYQRDTHLDAAKNGTLFTGDLGGRTISSEWLTPDVTRHTVFGAFERDLAPGFKAHAMASYTKRHLYSFENTFYAGDYATSLFPSTSNNTYADVSGGIEAKLGSSWRLRADASYSSVSVDQLDQFIYFDLGTPEPDPFERTTSTKSQVYSGRFIADGVLAQLPSGPVKLAVGGEIRRETLSASSNSFQPVNGGRTVKSIFAEASIPLGPPVGSEPLAMVSIAGRYDHYSDFGNTFNPQAGLEVHVTEDFKLRATYSRSFRAPSLYELGTSNSVGIRSVVDPAGVKTPVFFEYGGNGSVGPEKAEGLTAGLDYRKSTPKWTFGFSTSYLYIKYKDRVDQAAPTAADQQNVLTNAAQFPGVLNRTPSAAELSAALAADSDGRYSDNFAGTSSTNLNGAALLAKYPNIIFFDDRFNNISVETYSGIDFSAHGTLNLDRNTIGFNANATYAFSHKRGLTASSVRFSLLNDVGKPVDFRARGNVFLERGGATLSVYANYTASYRNTILSPTARIGENLTFDSVLYLDGEKVGMPGIPRRFTVSLGILNMFNRKPPLFVGNSYGILFDVANANGTGRQYTASVGFKF